MLFSSQEIFCISLSLFNFEREEYRPQSTVKGRGQGDQGGARRGSGADVAARGKDTATCDTNPENEKCVCFKMYSCRM